MVSYFICVFTTINSDDTKDITFEILENKQPINLFEKYDQIVVYNPDDLDLSDDLCKKILELEKMIDAFYYAHPHKLDKFEQNKVDQMELNLDQLKMIVKNKIENV